MNTSEVMFSRPTSSGWGGKATETLKTLVSDELKQAFIAEARRQGYQNESECLREIVMVFTLGADTLCSVHANRIRGLADRMSGKGPVAALQDGAPR